MVVGDIVHFEYSDIQGSVFLYEGHKVNSISYVFTVFEYAKGRLKNQFFPKKCPLDVSLRPPPEKRQYLKIPEINFFQILGSICFQLSKVRNRELGP